MTAVPAQGNDPHGIVYADGRYHLFFQYNPVGTVWFAACHWGRASSADLVTWQEHGIALAPGEGEVGCWSGSVVFDGDVPTILYTRITSDDWGRGQVALARGSADLAAWRSDASVIDGPPAGLDTIAFRDPYVSRADDGWRMIVGAELPGGIAAALQYRSDDLAGWRFDGVLAQRSTTETAGAWTGRLWECPQLFELDGCCASTAACSSPDAVGRTRAPGRRPVTRRRRCRRTAARRAGRPPRRDRRGRRSVRGRPPGRRRRAPS
jgi:beta-fructofuranosidase